jgi:hypothetical protein
MVNVAPVRDDAHEQKMQRFMAKLRGDYQNRNQNRP